LRRDEIDRGFIGFAAEERREQAQAGAPRN
jgi:hypothetical protein